MRSKENLNFICTLTVLNQKIAGAGAGAGTGAGAGLFSGSGSAKKGPRSQLRLHNTDCTGTDAGVYYEEKLTNNSKCKGNYEKKEKVIGGPGATGSSKNSCKIQPV